MESYLSGLAKKARDGISAGIDTQKFIKAAPVVSLTDLIFQRLRAGVPNWGSKPFIVDTTSDTIVYFKSLEQQSLRVASALARRGFRRGDVLYHVTYELAQCFVIMLAVWRLGGTVRGAPQDLDTLEYIRQIRETGSLMILVDAETAPKLREAIDIISWPFHMFSVGNATVPGASSFQDMIKDDAYPNIIDINPQEDVVIISNTVNNGIPIGISHTHEIAMEFLYMTKDMLPLSTIVHSMPVSSIVTFCYCIYAATSGITILHVAKTNAIVPPLLTIQHRDFSEVLRCLFYRKSIEIANFKNEDF